MTLENIWFFLVAFLLTGYVILDGFDLGAGVLYPFIARNEDEKRVVRASIGPVWDGNEVWLVTGAGAVFAAFPHGLRHDVQRLLPRHHARALRPDPARRLARVPPPRPELEQGLGRRLLPRQPACRRSSSAAPSATSSAASR